MDIYDTNGISALKHLFLFVDFVETWFDAVVWAGAT